MIKVQRPLWLTSGEGVLGAKVFVFSSRSLRGSGFVHYCQTHTKRASNGRLASARNLTHREVETLLNVQTFIAERT